jgi:group I intron endonuclease
MGFIYRITNTISKKCYIGETVKSDPEKRWIQHKNTIKRGIGCPALQSAVIKHGIDNFKFEVLLICFDEDRFKYEIEYIKKYNTLVPNGYNILEGGPGGGFKGKKHSEETKKLMSKNMKQKYINDIKFKKDISDGIKNYYTETNIIKHREAMSKSSGVKIGQYNLHNELINIFVSISEASRQTGISKSSIQKYVKDTIINRGFIWKYNKSI